MLLVRIGVKIFVDCLYKAPPAARRLGCSALMQGLPLVSRAQACCRAWADLPGLQAMRPVSAPSLFGRDSRAEGGGLGLFLPAVQQGRFLPAGRGLLLIAGRFTGYWMKEGRVVM